MKRFLVLLSLLSCGISYAATETINWYVDGNTYATTTCQTGGDITLPTTPTKYGYTFQGWGTYIPIEYIESTGTQYIDTEFVPNSYTKVQISFSCDSCADGGVIFGARSANAASMTTNRRTFALFTPSERPLYPRFDYSGTGAINIVYSSIALVPNTITLITKDKEKNYINNSQIDSNQPVDFFSLHSAYLFALNEGDTMRIPVAVKIYWTKIWDNGTLVRDFIPVLDPNDVPCMYDRVTDTFFYNSGTGDFIAGPVIE